MGTLCWSLACWNLIGRISESIFQGVLTPWVPSKQWDFKWIIIELQIGIQDQRRTGKSWFKKNSKNIPWFTIKFLKSRILFKGGQIMIELPSKPSGKCIVAPIFLFFELETSNCGYLLSFWFPLTVQSFSKIGQHWY